jgi:2-oxo-4-hydroxy-4-carboxy-5-ureidoimidazoline decarboxylase
MSSDVSISLAELNAADASEFIAALGSIYEHSPWVVEAVAARRPFATLAALHDSMSGAVMAADDQRKLALLNAHPDLAGKAARRGTLTPDSKSEQASAALDQLSEEEFAEFNRLNQTYRGKFGFPFIICVLRHSKESVLRQLELRTANPADAECDAALTEVNRIAALRLDRHVGTNERLPVQGRLSTHVLDTYHGRPANGVAVELHELAREGNRIIGKTVTNADGRTDRPLIVGRPVPIGRYELRFAIGAYFASTCGGSLADPAFLDIVPVQFSVAAPEEHYHVPLLASPWSYTTYRGS